MCLSKNGIQLREEEFLLCELSAYPLYRGATLVNTVTELVIPLETEIQVIDKGACGSVGLQWSTVEERVLDLKELLQGLLYAGVLLRNLRNAIQTLCQQIEAES